MRKVKFTETVLRDANQSLIATRLPYEQVRAHPGDHGQGGLLLRRGVGRRHL